MNNPEMEKESSIHDSSKNTWEQGRRMSEERYYKREIILTPVKMVKKASFATIEIGIKTVTERGRD